MKRPRFKPEVYARRGDYVFEVCHGVDRAAARELIAREHYSKSSSFVGTVICAKRGGEVVGAAALLPPLPPAARKHAKDDPKRVTSLSRIVVRSGEPQNVASMLIGATLKQVRRDRKYNTVLTYADLAQGHTGAIYRATNAQHCGLTKPKEYWADPATGRRVSAKATRSRTVAEMRALGYQRRVSPGKHCFKWLF